MGTELSHQALHVRSDGVRRQIQLLRYLLSPCAISHLREDLPLACGERSEQVIVMKILPLMQQQLEYPPKLGRRHPGLPMRDSADRA